MEATAEGLAAAAATREVLAAKKRTAQQDAQPASSKKARAPVKTCSHEVARPEGWKDECLELDETVHGELGVYR